MKILTRNGYIDSVALFYELTDEQLQRIKNDKNYLFDNGFLKECNYAKGDNAHFYCLCNNGETLDISEYAKDLLKTYKTISWWDKENKEFMLIRRELCQ